MRIAHLSKNLARLLGTLTCVVFFAQAGTMLSIPYGSPSGVLRDTDPTTDTRIGRDGTAATWAAPKPFPGLFGGTGTRAYKAFTLANPYSVDLYLQISLDDLLDTGDVFAAAYLGSFDPTDLSVNYIGDPGFSPEIFGNPVTFQVILPVGEQIVLVVNQVNPDPADLPLRFGLLVEKFKSPFFDAIPEPSTMALTSVAFAIVAWSVRRKQRA
jgi:hypothetical protein